MIKADLDNFASELNYKGIYAVQMDSEENRNGLYDMKSYHIKYDIEIGEVDNNGKAKYYDGESVEKYTSGILKTEYGEPIRYVVLMADKNNYETYKKKINDNAELNKIYAADFTSRVNIKNPVDFRVAGTPIVIVVKSGEIVKYAVGSQQVKELFNEHN